MFRECSVSLVLLLYIVAHWNAIFLAREKPKTLWSETGRSGVTAEFSPPPLWETEIGIYYNRLEYVFHMNILSASYSLLLPH